MENENQELKPEQEFIPATTCPVEEQPITPVETVANKVLPALKDTMFLVICILMSVSCLISLSLGNLPLINILATVFLWLTYAKSRKDIVDTEHLRCISGTIYAEYVIAYVVAVLFVVVGIILAIAFSFLTQESTLMQDVLSAISEDIVSSSILNLIASVSGIILLVAFVFLAGIIVVVNLFITRYIHRFVKSVYQSVEANALELKHTNAAKICLYIMGGFSAVSALSYLGSPLLFLSHAADCAVAFFAARLIQKYFQAEN